MKSFIVIAIGMAAVGVSAQGSTLTITNYYSSCPTATPSYTSTVTGTILQTYCPSCTADAAKAVPSNVILTTYTTVYTQTCPTNGLPTPATYTITAPCPTSGLPLPQDYVPPNFTVTTVPCPKCPGGGSLVVTTPVATPSAGPPVSAAPTPPVAPPASGSPPPSVPTGGVAGGPPVPALPPSPATSGAVGATPIPPSLPSSPKTPGSNAPVGSPQYRVGGNGSSPVSSGRGSVGTGTVPNLPSYTTGAAVALGRNIGAVGVLAVVVGGIYVCL